MKTLKDLFMDELADMYDAENRIVKALPKMAKAATCEHLKSALEAHLQETKGHVEKLEEAFASLGKKAKAKKCEATVGLLKEGDEIIAEFKGSPAINAAIISAGQKVEHYEIASYGTLHAWALLLGHEEAAGLIEEILNQEKAADTKLNELSLENNPKAMADNSEDFGDEGVDAKLSRRSQPLTRSQNGKTGSNRRVTTLNH